MTPIKTIFLAFFTLMGVVSFAQKRQGKVIFSHELISADSSEALAASIIQNMQTEISFTAGKMRVATWNGELYYHSCTIDSTARKGVIHKISGSAQTAAEVDLDSLKMPSFEIIMTEETTEILGFKCQRMLLKPVEQYMQSEIVVWFTDELSANFEGQPMLDHVPGFALQYIVKLEGRDLAVTATSFDEELGPGVFELTIPEGFEVVPLTEIK